MIIPIEPNIAYQRFNIKLGDYRIKFKISWVTRHNYFVASIADITEEEKIIAKGRVLNLWVNLLDHNIKAKKYGSMIVVGEEATIENIGKKSWLEWVPNV